MCFVLLCGIDLFLLAYFHNRFWWPADEGAYAHTAQRILAGETLNADVEEIHPGYHTFLNATAFRVFGLRLVSLRYPLAVAAFIQSLLLFLLFARSNLVAVIVGTSAIAMGVIQFLNPTPNWYCLLFAIIIAYVLHSFSERAWCVVIVGFVVGLAFLFRQITGVFLGMAVLTYLLTETRSQLGTNRDSLLARALLLLMLIGMVVYLLSATDAYGFVLAGIWPIVFLVLAIFFVSTSNRRALNILLLMGAGFVAACVPIFVYHVWHGSLALFFEDTVMRALHVSRFSYLKLASYATLQLHGLKNVLGFHSATIVVNGIYWFLLPFTMLVCGVATVRGFKNTRVSGAVGALPVIAVFYALVALLQQIPIYLSYALPLTFAGLFWLARPARKQMIWALSIVTVFFSVISVYYHAAQPLTRLITGTIRGDRIAFVPASTLERSGLWTDAQSLAIYTDLVQTIKQASKPDETLLVIPNNPEVYFLADRKNPFRFWNSAIGVRDSNEAAALIDTLRKTPPRIVVLSPADRNNTASSNEIVTYVKDHYSIIKTISGFEIYRAP